MAKPEKCLGCPLYYEGEGPVPPQEPSCVEPALVVVGEAPGADEVAERTPFVGPSGRLLRAFLGEAGVRSSHCFITNVVHCRPPRNATPNKEVVAFCADRFLDAELARFPDAKRLIVGSVASQRLLKEPVTESAGYIFPRGEALDMAVLHPAALLRQPTDIPITKRLISKFVRCREVLTADEANINLPPYKFVDFIARCRAGKYVVFDVETRGFEDLTLTCIGITSQHGETVTMTWNEQVARHVRPLFEDASVQKVAYNVRFDVKAMRFNGIEVAGDLVDIMRLVQLDDIGTSRQSLEAVAPAYLNIASWKQKGDVEGLLVYNARDAYYEWAIYRQLMVNLMGTPRWDLFTRTLSLDRVVGHMEERGFLIDTALLTSTRAAIKQDAEKAVKEWEELAPGVNPRSPKQLLNLFHERGIKVWKDNTGKESTEERYLKWTAARDRKAAELIGALLKVRKLSKLLSTYTEYVPSEDGALHCHIRTTGTVSGRFSFSEPNLGNIPKAKDDYNLRRIFVARPGYTLVGADWSQAESRVTATLANERKMLEVWANGRDVHRFTASQLFDIPEADVTKAQRDLAKRIVYGLSYGSGYRKLAELTEISFSEAKLFIKRFSNAFPNYFSKLGDWADTAAETGYLINPFGRVHTFSGDRTATQSRNFIPQSTVADMMNIVLCDLYDAIARESLSAHILLQIYDSVIIEVIEKDADKVVQLLHECMNRRWPELRDAVIPAEVKTGVCWQELD